nr:mesothelin-like protein [Salvelinus alpinus]
MTTTKIKNLVKACRRKGSNRVVLRETQLTCMYNYIKEETDVTSYNLYPPDMLLYYDYSKVSQDTCKDYFRELGDADFSVFSDALSFKRTALVNNAKTCLVSHNTSRPLPEGPGEGSGDPAAPGGAQVEVLSTTP